MQRSKSKALDRENNSTVRMASPRPVAAWGLISSDEMRILMDDREQLCDNIITAAMKLIMRVNPLVSIQPTCLPTQLLEYSPSETIHIHHNGSGHFVTSTSIGRRVRVYDSLNQDPTEDLLNQLAALYSLDSDPSSPTFPEVRLMEIAHEQEGGVNCGLFAIAYAVDLAYGAEPCGIVYNQIEMRRHLMEALVSGTIRQFPRYAIFGPPYHYRDSTKHISGTRKWSSPKKTARSKQISSPAITITTQNRFANMNDHPMASEVTQESDGGSTASSEATQVDLQGSTTSNPAVEQQGEDNSTQGNVWTIVDEIISTGSS